MHLAGYLFLQPMSDTAIILFHVITDSLRRIASGAPKSWRQRTPTARMDGPRSLLLDNL